VLSLDQWTTIRTLAAQGKGVRAIAREVGVDRKTVRRAIAQQGQPRYHRGPRPNRELEKLRPVLESWLFGKEPLRGSVIYERLTEPGSGYTYTGSAATLYRYLQGLQQERASQNSKATERFETPPGYQGQFDWSPYTVRLGGELTQICIFDLILGFSRRRHFTVSLDHSQGSVFEAIESSLRHFGGAPLTLLVDRAREMVADPSVTPVIWNQHFLELCGHYRMEPRACPPRRGQTKGKVEEPFFYMENHFLRGRDWASFDALVTDLAEFEARWEQRVHRTTGQTPLELFAIEREHLLPLPSAPFISSGECFHKVNHDCLVPYDGSRYSTPWPYAGHRVWLRPSTGRHLIIRNQAGEVIARHNLAPHKGMTIIDPEHYRGLRRRAARTRAMLEVQLLQRFPDCTWFCEAVGAIYRDHPEKILHGVVELSRVYPVEAMRAAMVAAREHHTYSLAFLRGVLAGQPPEDLPLRRESTPTQLALWPDAAVTADLMPYGRAQREAEHRG
jgi:transposase